MVTFVIGIVQLENYAKTEEAKVEELIKAVADSGAKVIVSGAAIGEMALHFCERYKYAKLLIFLFVIFILIVVQRFKFNYDIYRLMVLKISSKFELRRFCRTTSAVALVRLPEHLIMPTDNPLISKLILFFNFHNS